ncbi:MAG TPA: YchJ family metal-binding protein [Polyangiaceae bacterium]
MRRTSSSPCPCTSGRVYAECCAPLHRGQREAETPEALMRSRFAAFALGDAEYLWRTLHPDHEDCARDRATVLAALRDVARTLRFMRLTILDASGSRVLFHAAVFDKGKDRSFVELSSFARDDAGWRYVAGETTPAPGPAPVDWTIEDGFPRT